MPEMRFTNHANVAIETREDGTRTIGGYGAVFYDPNNSGTEYQLYKDLLERIAPMAFARALRENQDVRGLFNHDSNMVLGRTAAGTMRLKSDNRGLWYDIDPPDTQIGRDVVTSISRGDVTGSSFSFIVRGQQFEDRDDGVTIRTITDVDLYDVSPVVFPAYEGTTTGLRSGDAADALAARDAWRAEQANRRREADAVAVRARLLEIE